MTKELPNARRVRVDIVSDFVCPWCVLGYLRFSQASLKFKSHAQFDIRWQSFQLNPNIPEQGKLLTEHWRDKLGYSDQQTKQTVEHITQLGLDLGFRFKYTAETKTYNTLKAHMLSLWASEYGKSTEFHMALFRAYFGEGQNINDPSVLIDLCQGIGLDPNLAQAVLSENATKAQLLTQQQIIRQNGVNSVPTITMDSHYQLVGARSVADYQALISQLVAQQVH
ncbi:DsbA family oxidoreductase [Alginatibacterium sediminis]|uniref:DsbA family oxidoreductase n=1 Tax=Alginatibacterium sediminis TaxID=2164068 RepID=A0A420E8M1_9ALTE|nr:DsbA family oxidoreductase [Alginatibacterium sediminis]RKF15751.1 DsbA family oxidoreductase [Alginatibacterium sediminis]